MLCSGDREKGDVAMEEKWDYVVCPHAHTLCRELNILILTLLEFG